MEIAKLVKYILQILYIDDCVNFGVLYIFAVLFYGLERTVILTVKVDHLQKVDMCLRNTDFEIDFGCADICLVSR